MASRCRSPPLTLFELARSQGRGRFYILYELIFVFGLVAAALFGYAMVPHLGWQSLFYLGGLPALLALFLTRLLPESPRWLASKGRIAEADAIVSRIERDVAASGKVLPPPVPAVASQAPAGNRWLEMLGPAYRRRTLGVWAMWFCCFSTTYGLTTWIPTLYKTVFNLPLSQALGYWLDRGVAGILGALLCAFNIDRIGRASGCRRAVVRRRDAVDLAAWARPAPPCPWSSFRSAASSCRAWRSGLNLYTAEIYPTRIRAFASSIGGAWQRVAAASGPIVVAYLLTGVGLNAVFAYFGVIAVIGAAVAAATPSRPRTGRSRRYRRIRASGGCRCRMRWPNSAYADGRGINTLTGADAITPAWRFMIKCVDAEGGYHFFGQPDWLCAGRCIR